MTLGNTNLMIEACLGRDRNCLAPRKSGCGAPDFGPAPPPASGMEPPVAQDALLLSSQSTSPNGAEIVRRRGARLGGSPITERVGSGAVNRRPRPCRFFRDRRQNGFRKDTLNNRIALCVGVRLYDSACWDSGFRRTGVREAHDRRRRHSISLGRSGASSTNAGGGCLRRPRCEPLGGAVWPSCRG